MMAQVLGSRFRLEDGCLHKSSSLKIRETEGASLSDFLAALAGVLLPHCLSELMLDSSCPLAKKAAGDSEKGLERAPSPSPPSWGTSGPGGCKSGCIWAILLSTEGSGQQLSGRCLCERKKQAAGGEQTEGSFAV